MPEPTEKHSSASVCQRPRAGFPSSTDMAQIIAKIMFSHSQNALLRICLPWTYSGLPLPEPQGIFRSYTLTGRQRDKRWKCSFTSNREHDIVGPLEGSVDSCRWVSYLEEVVKLRLVYSSGILL